MAASALVSTHARVSGRHRAQIEVGRRVTGKVLDEAADRGVFTWLRLELGDDWDGLAARFIELLESITDWFLQ